MFHRDVLDTFKLNLINILNCSLCSETKTRLKANDSNSGEKQCIFENVC